ncbi:MAG: hypothetical protein MAG551_00583 [Candidatus Scalindua arabica]|uniref:Uncharacterized protein n=1 Tax=Candidatus Scalindua arabica TaxID=1127984 RepID=A0A941W058_9BACT|nr:hypothetical protein [Candidatus Scalindua arabica]
MKLYDSKNNIATFKSAVSKSERIVGSIPSIAEENGALLAIITLSETPLDSSADFVFHLKVEEFINLFQS